MDLATDYLGLALRNPLVASASPLSQSAASVAELVDAGVSAVVLPSLFEEQVAGPAGEPVPPEGPGRPEAAYAYLALLEECVRAVDVPVLASLNGTSRRGWTSFARQLQDTGAAAVECCFYAVPQHVQQPARDVEARCLDVARALVDAVDVPVTVKLTPYFSSFGTLALRLVETGVAGLVLFNRFLQPVIDVESLTVRPGSSSRSAPRRACRRPGSPSCASS